MRHFQKSAFLRQLLAPGVAALLAGVTGMFFAPMIFNRFPPLISDLFIAGSRTAARPPLPQAIVVRGASPETEQIAALLASLGSFDVFVASVINGPTGERINVESSDSCRLAAQMLTPDPVKPECILRAPAEPLPACSLGIDLRGPPDSVSLAQRAWIYVVLRDGQPCPLFDSLVTPDPYPVGGKQLRPWAGSRLVAEVREPTPWSILRALGIEPARVGG